MNLLSIRHILEYVYMAIVQKIRYILDGEPIVLRDLDITNIHALDIYTRKLSTIINFLLTLFFTGN